MVKTGTYAEPWSADTRLSRVDYRDVAEAAAIALMEDRLLYGAFELCAEGDLNRREVVTLMGEVPSKCASPCSLVPYQIRSGHQTTTWRGERRNQHGSYCACQSPSASNPAAARSVRASWK